MANRPRQVDVVKVDTIEALNTNLMQVSTGSGGAILEFDNAAQTSERYYRFRSLTPAVGIPVDSCKGIGVHVGTQVEEEKIELFEYDVNVCFEVPQTVGALHAEVIDVCPIWMRGTLTAGGGLFHMRTGVDGQFGVLPNTKVVIAPTKIVSATLGLNVYQVVGRGVLAVANEQSGGGVDGKPLGVGFIVTNRDLAQAWEISRINGSMYLRRWNEDVQSLNPNSTG
jgi:hypothetical protein